MDPVGTLRRLPLFNDLSEHELSLIGQQVTWSPHDAGAIIFSEGDVCREPWIVKEGSVKILNKLRAGIASQRIDRLYGRQNSRSAAEAASPSSTPRKARKPAARRGIPFRRAAIR